jgi:hypothetical protein
LKEALSVFFFIFHPSDFMRRAFTIFIWGMMAGSLLGLGLGWYILPTQFVEVSPADLNPELKADYLRLIAATYAQDNNLALARQRLADLRQPDLNAWVLEQTISTILANQNEQEIRDLVHLALSLGLESPAFIPFQPTPIPFEGGF